MQTEYYRIEWGHQCDICPVQKQCTQDFGGRTAPRSGTKTPRTNARGGVCQNDASAKRGRGDPQRVGARAWPSTDKISGAESSQLIALPDGGSLQRETISQSARLSDDNAGS